MIQFNSRLNIVLNQSIEQILHNRDGRLEVDDAKKQQMSLEPQSYLSIALFTIIRTDRNMLLACYSHKHISYRIRTIIRKAIMLQFTAIQRRKYQLVFLR
ncbi:hypothetical protein [Wolbachia endosymbiont (group A) of Scambus nigricans]|uniref:hypothetical protein n=1 Tax=Wolbachia endosymbiont (group A) of Scambus nigricans TaxID=2954055 RepID=UPI00222E5387|nr:hypothetical protein [Wolbachia endosymbiont (group A) of Scambus nigricans]